jgi:hypothetical protein
VRSRTISISSLAHLVHLASLKLVDIDVVPDPNPGEQQEQHQHEEQQQQQQQQSLSQHSEPLVSWRSTQQPAEWPAGAIQALSVRIYTASSFFVPSSVVACDLSIVYVEHVSLAQLAACPHLRQLRVCCEECIPDITGVSALTQLSRLRLEMHPSFMYFRHSRHCGASSPRNTQVTSSSSRVWREVAALKQLQLFEVPLTTLELTQLHTWLPQMAGLTQLAVLVDWRGDDLQHLQALKHLTPVLDVWRSSSSSSSSKNGGDGGGGSSSSTGNGSAEICAVGRSRAANPSCDAPAAPKLRALQLSVWCDFGPLWPYRHDYMARRECRGTLHSLQQTAAQLAAALPWLQVTCDWDAFYTPCWQGFTTGADTEFGTYDCMWGDA